MARLRGFVWLAAGVVLALLAGLVAYTTLSRVTQTPTGPDSSPRITVIAANRNIPLRTVLTLEDVREIELPADVVPEGALRSSDGAVGRLTMNPLYPGEAILEQELVDPNVKSPDGRKALYLLEDEVLMAIPAQDLLSRLGILKAGDHVDLLFTLSFPENRGIGASSGEDKDQPATFALLQNVTVVGLAGGVPAPNGGDSGSDAETQEASAPDAVLLTIAPQDALTLKYAIDAGGTIDIVMRAPGVERPFVTDPVDIDYLVNRYRIPTGSGR
ncbi:MAG: Flp pilus assembly protein CpaB [Anaerolineales bacterium]|nr:Flp pilus assembly protein CpaB [Anaerolineales bacterium]